ncbi:uncharacterized protein VTP21DRAFT_704 [Calcarisporiella thermophila]|uniref:uncharacterized protein n=1 Tax=Calcarisporiella thermophila TaxID=911321 RepID=UPI0037443547
MADTTSTEPPPYSPFPTHGEQTIEQGPTRPFAPAPPPRTQQNPAPPQQNTPFQPYLQPTSHLSTPPSSSPSTTFTSMPLNPPALTTSSASSNSTNSFSSMLGIRNIMPAGYTCYKCGTTGFISTPNGQRPCTRCIKKAGKHFLDYIIDGGRRERSSSWGGQQGRAWLERYPHFQQYQNQYSRYWSAAGNYGAQPMSSGTNSASAQAFPHVREICYKCDGSGRRIHFFGDDEICRKCQGTGRLSYC